MLRSRSWYALGGLLLLAALTLALAGVGLAAPAEQQEVRVEMTGPPPHFEPATITVPVGTRVTWVVTAGNHSSTSDTGLWDSGVGGVGTTVSYTFTQPGTYTYHCIPHRAVGMVGTVIVTAGPAPGALPRTGEAALLPGALALALGGLASLGAGALLRRRAR